MGKARAVWIGVGLAVQVRFRWLAFYVFSMKMQIQLQTIFETITYPVAVVLLTAMTF
jgi:hypothetical protein